jgi:hypothetical protein
MLFNNGTEAQLFYKRLNGSLFPQIVSIDAICAYVELNESAFDDSLDAHRHRTGSQGIVSAFAADS